MKLIFKIETKEIIVRKPDFFDPYFHFRFKESLNLKKLFLYKLCKISANIKNYYFEELCKREKLLNKTFKSELWRKFIRLFVYYILYPYSFSKFTNK